MNAPEPYRPSIMRLRRALNPYRRWLSLAILPVLFVPLANSVFDLDLFGVYGRKVFGVALLIGLVWFVLMAPDRAELEQMRERKRSGTQS